MLSILSNEETLQKIFLLSQHLMRCNGVDDIWEYISNTALAITKADAIIIRDFNPINGNLTIVKSHGLSQDYIDQPLAPLEEGIIEHVVSEGRSYIHNDISLDSEWNARDLSLTEGMRSVLCVPIKEKDSSTGCITVMRKQAEPFSEQELFLLNIFGLQASEAIKIVKLVSALKQQAMYDYLTQIYNKNALHTVCEQNLALAKRYATPMSVIFIDIDNFKVFNDTHGHLLGDKLLCDFARILKRSCRKIDSVGRFGGEEFIILAPHTNKKKAVAFANKIRRIVEKNTFLGKGDSVTRITFSAGISSFPDDGETIPDLLNKADSAMYQSKIAGKNRVTPWMNKPALLKRRDGKMLVRKNCISKL